jgi:O-antigen/teichoic acid export membrane protein
VGNKWLITLVDQGIYSGASFLAGVIIGRIGGKEQLGLYVLGITIVSLLMQFQGVMVWAPYMVFSPQLEGHEHSLYTGSTLIHQLGLSTLGIVALIGLGVLLSSGLGPAGLEKVIWMLVVAGPFIALREYVRHICFATVQLRVAIMLDCFTAVVQSGVLLWLALVDKLSASSALGALGLGCGLASLAWLVWARKGRAFSLSRVFSDLARNWSFGKWVLGGNLAEFAHLNLFPWMLTGFHGVAALGTLSACQGVVGLTSPFLYGTMNFLGPQSAHTFAQGGLPALRVFVAKSTLAIVIVFSLCGAAIIIFGDQLVTLFYGRQYGGNAWLISFLALNSLAYAFSLGVDYGIWAMGRSDLTFKINLLLLGTTLTVGLALVMSLGVLGVAFGLLAGNLAALMLRFKVFNRLSRVV